MARHHLIILTDLLQEPFDEGARISTLEITRNLKNLLDVVVISTRSDSTPDLVDRTYNLNRLLFSFSFYKDLRKISGDAILYIPESAATIATFLRTSLLKFLTGKKVFILSYQPRRYRPITRLFLKLLSPECVITQSTKSARYLSRHDIKSLTINLGVDRNRFREYSAADKEALRIRHNLPRASTVLLHVGHIQPSRNLEWLIEVKKILPTLEILVVGSTYNQNDEILYRSLLKNGIQVIDEFVPEMVDIYNLANYYIFPVTRVDGAIDTPLSVLEAMACNLPIITTRFGSLPDVFENNDDFHFVESAQEIIEILHQARTSSCKNREIIKPFTWEEIGRQLIDIVKH